MALRTLFIHAFRLVCLSGLTLGSACSGPGEMAAPRLDPADWRMFAEAFVEPSGRVRDAENGDISHSEGQGYAMLFAAAAGDEDAFRRIWGWTKRNLQIRGDALLAWRWDPASGTATDRNNATDGDLLVAWALIEASERWNDPALRAEAEHILDGVKKRLIVDTSFGPALLPGMEGFIDNAGDVTLNLSYWIFSALSRFERSGDAHLWRSVSLTGKTLIREARFGRFGLPLNWITIEGEAIAPAADWPALYAYDAVRVPIYLCLAERLGGAARATSLLAPFRRFYAQPLDVSNYEWRVLDDSAAGPMPHDLIEAIRSQLNNMCAPSGQRLERTDGGRAYYESALLLLMRIYGE